MHKAPLNCVRHLNCSFKHNKLSNWGRSFTCMLEMPQNVIVANGQNLKGITSLNTRSDVFLWLTTHRKQNNNTHHIGVNACLFLEMKSYQSVSRVPSINGTWDERFLIIFLLVRGHLQHLSELRGANRLKKRWIAKENVWITHECLVKIFMTAIKLIGNRKKQHDIWDEKDSLDETKKKMDWKYNWKNWYLCVCVQMLKPTAKARGKNKRNNHLINKILINMTECF